jgi:hopene-associated glycosyltransferase HpnB
MTLLEATALASLAAWLVLVFAHGRFWVGDQRLEETGCEPEAWPEIAAVVPARNEADVIARTVGSLLDQDYPGRFHVVLADDESDDDTAGTAARAASAHPRGVLLQVERTPPRPEGWVGKMWAQYTGVRRAEREAPDARYWLLTDADVAHSPGNLRRLVTKAEAERLELVSLMVRLHTGEGWDRLLVPAFVYFFQKLYPFPRVNDPRSRVAAAAGGCVLVRRDALERAGGIEALRGEIIDDCALGRAVKRGGPIWLGLTATERSIRPYEGIGDVWNMVARSAFTQLHYSWALLAGTLFGLVLLYAVPPALTLAAPWHGSAAAAGAAAAAWIAMALSFAPTLALYGRAPLWGAALPLAGILYAAMTLDSARRHACAEGAHWKGRPGAGARPASRAAQRAEGERSS